MKKLNALLILLAMLGGAAQAASHSDGRIDAGSARTSGALSNSADMVAGEIRKIDLVNNKVTIKHDEIKNLDMPGMTMVFQIKDAALLTNIKVGDSIRFMAEKAAGTIVVTAIQAAGPASKQTGLSTPQPSGDLAPVLDKKPQAAMTATEMTEGEVRKVDLANSKITIKHDEIKNLDMPGMTMVFQVKESELLAKSKAGDKIRFKAEKSNGVFVVTDIQVAK